MVFVSMLKIKAVEPYFFDNENIGVKETFTITYNDLLKAYAFNKDFRELISKRKIDTY